MPQAKTIGGRRGESTTGVVTLALFGPYSVVREGEGPSAQYSVRLVGAVGITVEAGPFAQYWPAVEAARDLSGLPGTYPNGEPLSWNYGPWVWPVAIAGLAVAALALAKGR